MNLRTILVATDDSPQGQQAALFATDIAHTLRAETVELMTLGGEAANADTATTDAPAEGNEVCALVKSSCAPRSGSVLRRFAVQIAERAQEIDADMTIVETQAKGFVAELQMRVRNNELLLKTAGPILFLRRPPETVYTQVLIPVDFSRESKAAARLAMAIAPSAQYTFLHAFQLQDEGIMHELSVPPSVITFERRRAEQRAQHALQEFAAEFATEGLPLTCAVEYGDAVPVIQAYASRMQAQLIVIGRHGRPRLQQLLLGNVAQRLVDLATTDLLIASNKGERK